VRQGGSAGRVAAVLVVAVATALASCRAADPDEPVEAADERVAMSVAWQACEALHGWYTDGAPQIHSPRPWDAHRAIGNLNRALDTAPNVEDVQLREDIRALEHVVRVPPGEVRIDRILPVVMTAAERCGDLGLWPSG
jgi:hypothetical protein